MACSAHFPQHPQHSQHPQHPQHSHHPQHFQHPQKEYHVYHDHSPAAYCAEEEEELVDARLSAYVCGMEEMERVQEMIRRLQNKYHEFSSVIALKSDEVQKLNSDIMKRNDELHAISQNVRYFQNEKTQQEHQLREVSLAVSTKQRELERLSKAISNERLEHANDVAQEKLIITGIVRQRKEEETAVERLRQQRLEEELKLRLCMDKQTLHTTEQSHLHWEAQDKQKQAELEREKIAALDAVLERQQVEMSEKLCAVADDRLYELDTLRMMQKTALSSSQTCVTAPCRQATGGSVGGAELDATPQAESLFVSFAKPSSRRHEVLKSLNEQMSKLRRADEGKSGDVRLSLETATVLFDSIISANTQIDALKARSGQTFMPADDESATKDLRMQSFRSQFQQEKEISRGINRYVPPVSTLHQTLSSSPSIPLLGSPEISSQIPRALPRCNLVQSARPLYYRDDNTAPRSMSPGSSVRREAANSPTHFCPIQAVHSPACQTLFGASFDGRRRR